MPKSYRRNKRRFTMRVSDPTYEVAQKKKNQTGKPMHHWVDRAIKKAYPLEYKQALQKIQERKERELGGTKGEANLE